MFRSLKKAAVKVGVTKEADEDAYDRERLHTLGEAAEAVKRAATALLKGVQEWGAGAGQAHEAMFDLNPLGAPLSGTLDALVAGSDTFVKAREGMDEARLAVDLAVAGVLERERALLARVAEREALRVDVKHYVDKLEGLHAKAATTAKEVARIDENEVKHKAAVEAFEAAHAALAPDMERLDAEVDGIITPAFRALLEAHAKVLAAASEAYVAALAAPPPTLVAAAAVAGGASAAGGAAAGGAGAGAGAGGRARTSAPARASMFARLNPFSAGTGAHDGWKASAPPPHTVPGGSATTPHAATGTTADAAVAPVGAVRTEWSASALFAGSDDKAAAAAAAGHHDADTDVSDAASHSTHDHITAAPGGGGSARHIDGGAAPAVV